jgi:hypothetical protein
MELGLGRFGSSLCALCVLLRLKKSGALGRPQSGARPIPGVCRSRI